MDISASSNAIVAALTQSLQLLFLAHRIFAFSDGIVSYLARSDALLWLILSWMPSRRQ